MVTSVSTKGPQPSEERNTAPEGSLGLTVTGVDAKGHMFRERTAVLSLDGRDCKYQSKHEVRSDSWVLLDIEYGKGGKKSSRVQGKVKSVQPVGATHELFQIGVELEVAQSVRVVSNHEEGQLAVQETSAPEPPVAATEPRGRAEAPAPPTEAHLHTPPHPSSDEGAAGMAQSHELQAMVREAVKSAVVSEINQHLGALRNMLSGEVEKAVQATTASRMEKMIRDAVEKQISQNYQAALQALNSDLAGQLVGRLTESGELRTSFENMAKNLVERLTELSQTAAVKTEQDVNARATALRQSFEETIGDMRRRIKDMQADVEATLARAQASEKQVVEATLRVQETLERLKEADRITMEKCNGRLAAHLDACSAEFKERLDEIVKERAARFASELEQQLIPHLQRADETLEKLAAGLQLAQGSLRVQQEQLAELSRTAAADFEKDIKAFLHRLSGSA